MSVNGVMLGETYEFMDSKQVNFWKRVIDVEYLYSISDKLLVDGLWSMKW